MVFLGPWLYPTPENVHPHPQPDNIQKGILYIPYAENVNREENFWVNTQWRDEVITEESSGLLNIEDDETDESCEGK